MRRLIVAAVFSLGLGLFATSQDAQAVHKNYDNTLTCGNCHTMHNSQGSTATGDGNASLGGSAGGSLILLRGAVSSRAEIHNFCLQCHASNGAQAGSTFNPGGHTAPKVYIDGKLGAGNSAVAGTLDSFAVIGAGGDFSREISGNSSGWTTGTTVAQGYGHSLGALTVTPPGGDASISAFSCTNCHDPHGAYDASTATVNKYRNLRISATGASSNSGVTLNSGIKSHVGDRSGPNPARFTPLGTQGTVAATNRTWPLYDNDAALTGTPASDVSRSNTYPVAAADGSGTDGISKWCAQCHDNWHENIVTANKDSNGSDWHRHPVDNKLLDATPQSGASVTIIDTANYGAQIATYKALPIADINGTASGVAYLPTGQEANSKVFCLSCHFAHGGPYYDLLRWDYLASVGPAGSQSGNSIASTVGCQLCHNR
ncbi:MAG: hypothetical protein HY886_09940 [Deltaproteobacteria bacterium]|nr:hypothetical protein [Deltaproteobacteria bacterium]